MTRIPVYRSEIPRFAVYALASFDIGAPSVETRLPVYRRARAAGRPVNLFTGGMRAAELSTASTTVIRPATPMTIHHGSSKCLDD